MFPETVAAALYGLFLSPFKIECFLQIQGCVSIDTFMQSGGPSVKDWKSSATVHRLIGIFNQITRRGSSMSEGLLCLLILAFILGLSIILPVNRWMIQWTPRVQAESLLCKRGQS
jgi:hypothetical protein